MLTQKTMQLRKIEIEDYIFANDFLRLFDRSFQKNVKSHVFFWNLKKTENTYSRTLR